MRATSFAAWSMILLSGCVIAERPGAVALPDNAPPLTYEEMLTRARGQASAAQEAFYLDAWIEVEQSAQRLEQSARLLPKSTLIPVSVKDKLDAETTQLRQDAQKLGAAARARDATQINETMQRINQRIRTLRP